MTETEGENRNQGGKRAENRRKEKGQNMQDTHLLGGCHVGAIFTLNLEINFGTKPAHQERLSRSKTEKSTKGHF